MSKILLLSSGGLRSAVMTSLVTTANKDGVVAFRERNREAFSQEPVSRADVIALCMNYEQPNASNEMYYSRMFCNALGEIDWRAILISRNIGDDFKLSGLVFNSGLGLVSMNGSPLGAMVRDVITTVARMLGVDEVVSGVQDASSIWHFGSGVEGVLFRYPLLGLDNSEVVALGRDLGTPMQISTSCVVEGMTQCKRCSKCLSRGKAFEINGLVDSIEQINLGV